MAERNLNLYNSNSRNKELFEPQHPPVVQMYVCGPTVYDSAHLGHARAAVVFDLLYRILQHLCLYDVNYIRNYTDIDDKIIARANELGETAEDLARRYIEEYEQDMGAMGVLEPTLKPKVTENIDGIIRYIETLIDKGHAYAAGGSVYFSVASFEHYGKLSGRDTESMLSGQRLDEDFSKKDQLDFALWKAARPDEPFWESPWGNGRPGWHIECSVMSGTYAAPTLDIHGGGRDLLFPHHENETAQSECVHSQQFVRYWVHNGFVNIGTEKMSKSLKNFVTVGEIIEHWPAEMVRYFLLSSHYRSMLEFTWSHLADTAKQVEKFYVLQRMLEQLTTTATGDERESELHQLEQTCRQQIAEALLDDMNTPRVLAALHDYSRNLNRWLDNHRKAKIRQRLGAEWQAHLQLWNDIRSWTGLFERNADDFFADFCRKGLKQLGVKPEKVHDLVQQREAARASKDWTEADRLREQLVGLGLLLEDTGEGTSWRIDPDALARQVADS